MKKNITYLVTIAISFFLISVSTASIIPAKEIFETTQEKKIGDQLKDVVLEDTVKNKFDLIFEHIENKNKKIIYLKSLSKLLENPDRHESDMFNNFVNNLYLTYEEEFDSFSRGSSDSLDLPEDKLESDSVEFENIFDFTLIKPKSKERKIDILFNEISKKLPFLKKVLELFTKKFVETDFECLSSSDKSLSLYYKGSEDAIITGPLYKINSFLLILEAAVIYKQSGINDLDYYCNKLNAESDIILDDDLANNFETIAADLNLKSRFASLGGLSNEGKKTELDEIIADVQNHTIYQDTYDAIYQKLIDNDVSPESYGVISLVIGLALMYIGVIIFSIGLAAAVALPPLGMVYMSIGVIFFVGGYIIAFG